MAILFASTIYGTHFRTHGLGTYLKKNTITRERSETSLYVDFNLLVVSRMMTVFPKEVPFLGWKAPFWILARPVPRAFWPGKPDGNDLAAEYYFGGAKGTTVASTFVGESYMAAGWIGVACCSALIGYFSILSTKKFYQPGSEFSIVVYGSSFFAAAISMRSIYMILVALLPTFAAIAVGYFSSEQVQRHSSAHGQVRSRR